ATAEPPFSETLLSAGRPLARRSSLAGAAPTNPTGTPMTRAGSTCLLMISYSAVGAQPTSQMAPGPASPCASLTAAALSVMFAVRASRADCDACAASDAQCRDNGQRSPAGPDRVLGAGEQAGATAAALQGDHQVHGSAHR